MLQAGSAETVMGNVLKKTNWKRSDLVISTKVNTKMNHKNNNNNIIKIQKK